VNPNPVGPISPTSPVGPVTPMCDEVGLDDGISVGNMMPNNVQTAMLISTNLSKYMHI
jgi:hypothetical protein